MDHTVERLLSLREVQTQTGIARPTIYRMMGQGAFPRPVKIGPRAVRWKASDIESWIASRPVATYLGPVDEVSRR